MAMPTVLLIGESSTLNYLTFVFTRLHWKIVLTNINDIKFLSQNGSIEINDSTFDYQVDKVVNNFEKLREVYDLVIITSKLYPVLSRKLFSFKNILNESSIILLDCWDCPWLFEEIDSLFPKNIVLGMYSNVDCRRLSTNPNRFKLLSTENIILMIGVLSNYTPKPNLSSVLECEYQGVVFNDLIMYFKVNNDNIKLLPCRSYMYLVKTIWKNLIPVICLHSLTIVFEQFNIFKLSQDISVKPLLNGTLNEVLTICSELGFRFLPKSKSSEADQLLQILIISEANINLRLHSTLKLNLNSLDSNPSYYEFINGFEFNLIRLFTNLLLISQELNLETPYLESVKGFLNTLLLIRNTNHSQIFHLKKSLLNFDTINGITPDHNMMNFPPFNPLPCPTAPTQFNTNPLVMMVKQKDDGDNESIVSIDPAVKEVYDQTFRIDEPKTSFSNQTHSPPIPQNLSNPLQSPPPQIYPQPSPYPFPQQYHQAPYNAPNPYQGSYSLPPQPYPYQGQVPTPYPQNQWQGNSPYYPNPAYISPGIPIQRPINEFNQPPMNDPGQLPTSGVNQSPVKDFSQPTIQFGQIGAPPLKKNKSFHHLQPAIDKNTSIRDLCQYHSEFLESVKFDSLMDTTVPSRYGKYDTSTVKLNSANNSRASKGSESLKK